MEVDGEAMEPVGEHAAGMADILVAEINAVVVQQEDNVDASGAVGLADPVPLLEHENPADNNAAVVHQEAIADAGVVGLVDPMQLIEQVIPAVNDVVVVQQEAIADSGGDVGLADGAGCLNDQPEAIIPVVQDETNAIEGAGMGLGDLHVEG
jgi:hypothetical protein